MRYLPLTDADRAAMLAAIGADSVEALFRDVPRSARLDRPVDLPRAMGELEVERALARMAARNMAARPGGGVLGAGASPPSVPAPVSPPIPPGPLLATLPPLHAERLAVKPHGP